MTKRFTASAGLPVNAAEPVITYSPVTLQVPGRPVPLEVKVSVPATGADLPVILFSHGHGMSNFLSSLRGYGPLVDFWAAHGFVVLQPTHLDFTGLGLRDNGTEDAPLFWRSRVEDMHFVLDHLDEIEQTVPGLAGRVNWTKIAAVGHSLGGHTVSMLAGMTVANRVDGTTLDRRDERILASVIMAGPGAGEDLAGFAAEHYPDLAGTTFDTMTGQALIVVGDKDHNAMFTNRKDWRADPYHRSPGHNKTLITVFAAEHMLGGVSGYDAGETTDESPERVAAIRAMIWAYLRSALVPGDRAWDLAVQDLGAQQAPFAKIDTRTAQ
ncbi:chlorophyllase-like protein [Micromonospora sp. Llam0]|uniref:alpha/beta hydrolase family protein n=1 Tax=Micromonospora sp. Llam0 TaxID=2485143 RepID=UPI000F4A656B|nr:alpha/beta fold hydrolase [Micromonospora sp. Llam0]ROO60653.1 chlorophyllase-like protein [Micromonospora sp. Llam0]